MILIQPQRLATFVRVVFAAVFIAAQLAAAAQSFGGRTLDELKQAAADGDVQAQLLLGDALLNGKGTKKDPVEGVAWIRKAAEQGAPDAYYILGICHDIGSGVERSVVQATDWYRKAAEAGIVDAQYNLADCYLRGEGVEKNVKEAVKWLERAAEKGDVAAVAQLGFIYLNDTFGVRDPAKAATYLRKAAYTGNSAAAKWALGTLYQSGEGVAQSDEDAVKWFKESAMQGDSTGMYHLAKAMMVGRGLPKDELRAVEWMEKSAQKGNPKAKEFLEQQQGPTVTAAAPSPVPTPAVEKPAEAAAPKPSFVTAPAPTEERESFASFVSTPPGAEPAPRDTGISPGFSAAPTAAVTATAATNDGGFASFLTGDKPGRGETVAGDTNSMASMLDSAEAMARDAAAAAMAKFATEKESETETKAGSSMPESPPFAREPDDASRPGFAQPGKQNAEAGPSATGDAVETRVVYRDGGRGESAFPVAIAYMTLAMASAMVIISLLFFLTFKTRIRSLEGEIKKAQFELSKANVNLSSMMHQVEQLALKAPEDSDDGPGAVVSLPEWEDIKSQASAEGFKISRSR